MSLFDRGMIGNLELLNRFVRSATGEMAANKDGTITQEFFPMYSNLTKGEVGFIIQGDLYVLDEGKLGDGMAGISQDYHLEGLKQITQLVHNLDSGSVIAAQLGHGGAYGAATKAPSPRKDIKVQQMTTEDIENVLKGFHKAALRTKNAGYDLIQINSAHGYLLSQFLSSKTNQRTESWGGSIEKRAQLLLSVYQETRSAVGSDFPVIVKINGSDDPAEGFSVEDCSRVAKKLADVGLDAIEISGMESDRKFRKKDEAYFATSARKIHQYIGDMPLILVGGLRTYSRME